MKEKLKHIAQQTDLGKYFEILEVVEEKKDKYCIFAESYDGITLDDCEKIMRFIQKNLKDSENIELTVSSPGLDRPLKYPIQIIRHKGEKVEVTTNTGTKLKGKIVDYKENKILLEIKKGNVNEIKEFYFNELLKIKLIIDLT
ncbi:MAG: hypothetical protein N3A01_01525 [Bacteroidales bacterium]|nr:hypothetical protein [Bacteroidales bacterium]